MIFTQLLAINEQEIITHVMLLYEDWEIVLELFELPLSALI